MTTLFSPALALGLVLSTAYAAFFNLWQKGNFKALRVYVLAAWIGFAVGHFAGQLAGVEWLLVGQLNVAGGTAGAAACLVIAKLLEK
jgi:NADPH-dependent curcumin reductase CurA